MLDLALERFLERGYEATSIGDLVTATGLSRASLYNAWGDKRGLFEAVLDHYEARQMEKLRAYVAGATTPREALVRVLESVAGPNDGKGCLMINSGVELAGCDAAIEKRARESMAGVRAMFAEQLERAGAKNPEAAVEVLEGVFLGLRVMARMGGARAKIRRVAKETVDFLLPG